MSSTADRTRDRLHEGAERRFQRDDPADLVGLFRCPDAHGARTPRAVTTTTVAPMHT